jgi:hypothetical protein
MDLIKSSKKSIKKGTLFLQGVFKKDCRRMEEMFQDRLMTEVVLDKHDTIHYNKIPLYFNSKDQWIKSTNLLCWYCHRSFKNMPWFEPQSIEPVSKGQSGIVLNGQQIKDLEEDKGVSIIIKGNFCSKNCVSAYILKNTKDVSERIDKMNMLKYVCHIMTGKKIIDDIIPSPSPTEMIQYGGDLLPAEYQKKIDDINFHYEDLLSFNKAIGSFINKI